MREGGLRRADLHLCYAQLLPQRGVLTLLLMTRTFGMTPKVTETLAIRPKMIHGLARSFTRDQHGQVRLSKSTRRLYNLRSLKDISQRLERLIGTCHRSARMFAYHISQMTQTTATNRRGLYSYGPRPLPRLHLLRSTGFVTDFTIIVILLGSPLQIRL